MVEGAIACRDAGITRKRSFASSGKQRIELPGVLEQLEVSEQIYYRWGSQFGGMKGDDVKRLKDMEA
jgi:hypothetical protein